ncbi:DUF4242 domain-containing protein [Zunongwangia sp. F260]|uniref:DUF4242 domain-containing protein n=1 Tax=Autumnicola lenta TaxID=3075593 RepID=A0ABU3CIY8_9FLAO|nr:nickel-binding protein [Zunongwangia sp. F260]MDT0646304.1 DUF4242 domain-containing protein [Zunongwangia sp. F260]
MPIYMDRHDVSKDVTAEVVADLHQKDLKIQHKFKCTGLTYWYDDNRKTAFCLYEAPNKEAIKEMHEKAHGQVPHQIIEVEPSIVESFLSRIEDPENSKNTALNIINDPAFRTIMVVGLKGLSLHLQNSSQFKSLLSNLDKNLLCGLIKYKGKLVNQTEECFLVSFKSVSNAVHAAFDIRSKFKKSLEAGKEKSIYLKIGISAGVPVTEKNSIFEDSIILAKRMCEFVKGEIILSSEVNDIYKSENSNTIIKIENLCTLTMDDEFFLNHLMDYVDSSWTDVNLKVTDFSKPLGCSKSKLYHKIKSLSGNSPNTFIKEYRLSKALGLLNKTSGNISEIAFDTGFSSPSYFSKCFRKKYGNSPSAYLDSRIN